MWPLPRSFYSGIPAQYENFTLWIPTILLPSSRVLQLWWSGLKSYTSIFHIVPPPASMVKKRPPFHFTNRKQRPRVVHIGRNAGRKQINDFSDSKFFYSPPMKTSKLPHLGQSTVIPKSPSLYTSYRPPSQPPRLRVCLLRAAELCRALAHCWSRCESPFPRTSQAQADHDRPYPPPLSQASGHVLGWWFQPQSV